MQVKIEQWEYLEHIADPRLRFSGQSDGVTKEISSLGYEGWELVCVLPEQELEDFVNKLPERWIFKRQVLTPVTEEK